MLIYDCSFLLKTKVVEDMICLRIKDSFVISEIERLKEELDNSCKNNNPMQLIF